MIWFILSGIFIAAACFALHLSDNAACEKRSRQLNTLGMILYAIALAVAVIAPISANAAPLPKKCRILIPEMQKAYKNHPIPAPALAAQIHQESSCNPLAKSHAGAVGLSQFTPPTLDTMRARHKITCNWRKPPCALKLQTAYMRDIWMRIPAKNMPDKCERWGASAAAYNSGRGWQIRNWRIARAVNGNDSAFFGDGTESFQDRRRANWSIQENRNYARYIFRRQSQWEIEMNLKGICGGHDIMKPSADAIVVYPPADIAKRKGITMQDNFIIYRATAPNGKSYIGQTCQRIKKRIGQHAVSKSIFGNAVRKYGDKMRWEVLSTEPDVESANKAEIAAIAKYNTTIPNGYNFTTGGSAPERTCKRGVKHSESHRKKLSAHLTSPEHRAKLSAAISEANRRPWSAERKERHAAAMRELAANPEWRIKNAAAVRIAGLKNRGENNPAKRPEARFKISQAAKARWAAFRAQKEHKRNMP